MCFCLSILFQELQQNDLVLSYCHPLWKISRQLSSYLCGPCKPAYSTIPSLCQVGVPCLFLTATLPPILESQLREESRSSFLTIRGDTRRPNLTYNILIASTGLEALNTVASALEEALRKFAPTDRAIIFCQTWWLRPDGWLSLLQHPVDDHGHLPCGSRGG